MKIRILVLTISLIISSLTACDNNKDLIWRPEILTPLAKGDLKIAQEAAFTNIKYQYSTNTLSTGISSLTFPANSTRPTFQAFQNGISVPTIYNIGGLGIQQISLDSLTMYGILSNPLPITLLAGMQIVLKNQGDATPILVHTLQRNIVPQGKYTFIERSKNVVLKSNYEILYQKVSSPGSTTPITFTSDKIVLDYELSLSVGSVVFNASATSSLEIVEDFSLDFNESEEITGDIVLNTVNTLPFTFQIQVFFLAKDKTTVLGTLYTTPAVVSAGSANAPTKQSLRAEASAILTQFKNIGAVRVVAVYSVGAGGAGVTVNKNDGINFKLIADAKVKIKTD